MGSCSGIVNLVSCLNPVMQSATVVTCTLNASVAVVGQTRSVCISANSGGSFLTASTSLSVVAAQSVSPVGLGTVLHAGATLLTLSGTGLSSSDVVVLVAVNAQQSNSCQSMSGAPTVSTVCSSGSGSTLAVALSSMISSGQLYWVCIQYRGTGLFYGMSSASGNQFSAVSVTGFSPNVFPIISGSAQTITVTGAGLSTRDVYYAVSSGTSCTSTGSSASGVTLSAPTQVSFGTLYSIGATVSIGESFELCVLPGGNSIVTSGLTVGHVSAVSVSSFSPVAIPPWSNVLMTIVGAGLPVGGSVSVKVCFCCCVAFVRFFLWG